MAVALSIVVCIQQPLSNIFLLKKSDIIMFVAWGMKVWFGKLLHNWMQYQMEHVPPSQERNFSA
eukprot:10244712-Ditylum_brightwellii.AAC.1